MRQRTFLVSISVALASAVLGLPTIASALSSNANPVATEHVCGAVPTGVAHCDAIVVVPAKSGPSKGHSGGSSFSGYTPTQIVTAYGFPTSPTAGTGQTIAIVDAYNDPTALSDLSYFSSSENLQVLPSCSGTNAPCFSQVSQTGSSTSLPATNAGWALEISLDIEWAHAIAPAANIVLVEANSASFSDLLTAERYAATRAAYVSNSWGGSESSSETSYDGAFTTPQGTTPVVSFFVAAGDSGLPAEYPSASPNVISVGGTTLTLTSGGTIASETGWSSGGGGCSAYETANSNQSGFKGYGNVNCNGMRATPDVALDADPATGVQVYDSTRYSGKTGWWVVGGTSASTPMWAARSADTGGAVTASTVYATNSTITFHDITSGGNSGGCLIGYDLCSGLGSWNG